MIAHQNSDATVKIAQPLTDDFRAISRRLTNTRTLAIDARKHQVRIRCLALVAAAPIVVSALLLILFTAQSTISAALPPSVSAADRRSIGACASEIVFAFTFFLSMKLIDRYVSRAARHIDGCISQLSLPLFASADAMTDVAGQSLAHIEGQLARYRRRNPVDRSTPVRLRRHRRITPRTTRVAVTTADGRSLIGNIKDISLSGVAMSQLPRLKVGDVVQVGRRRATATRVWESGIAFAFTEELDPISFDESIVL